MLTHIDETVFGDVKFRVDLFDSFIAGQVNQLSQGREVEFSELLHLARLDQQVEKSTTFFHCAMIQQPNGL